MKLDDEPPRRAHAYLNVESRHSKARKIESLLKLDVVGRPLRLLEIGCGGGGIAHYFATRSGTKCEVHAVDVVDNLTVRDGFHFKQVTGTTLPFDDASFDVVISNHVVEHVGDTSEQQSHIAEINRVLVPDGVAYLAVPNRWQVVEPHYRLPFLSWLPRRFSSQYVRLLGKGEIYDCFPLSMSELEILLSSSTLQFQNICVEALYVTLELEYKRRLLSKGAKLIPGSILYLFRGAIPTLVYRLWRPSVVTDNSP